MQARQQRNLPIRSAHTIKRGGWGRRLLLSLLPCVWATAITTYLQRRGPLEHARQSNNDSLRISTPVRLYFPSYQNNATNFHCHSAFPRVGAQFPNIYDRRYADRSKRTAKGQPKSERFSNARNLTA
jgi:hypothetical protein